LTKKCLLSLGLADHAGHRRAVSKFGVRLVVLGFSERTHICTSTVWIRLCFRNCSACFVSFVFGAYVQPDCCGGLLFPFTAAR